MKNLEERRGKPARIVLGDPLPDEVEILPSPERLEECCSVAGESGGVARERGPEAGYAQCLICGGEYLRDEEHPELLRCLECVERTAIMRHLPIVQIEGLRKVYVRRSDVVAYLESRTFTKSEVPS